MSVIKRSPLRAKPILNKNYMFSDPVVIYFFFNKTNTFNQQRVTVEAHIFGGLKFLGF